MHVRATFSAVLLLLVSALVSPTAAAPRVHLELVTVEGAPINASQKWLAALKDVPFSSVRIRASRTGDRPEVKQQGSGETATYDVVGILSSRNTLLLQGQEFAMSDTAGINRWLTALIEGGGERGGKTAFGLSAEELVAIHAGLSLPVIFETKGLRSFDVLKKIAAGVGMPFTADAAAQQSLAADAPVLEELQGVSSGTAMAAILRPLGLVLVPAKQGKEIKLQIVDVRQARESWPVGWPPEKSPREAMPELFTFLNVEIKDTALQAALEAIRGRLKAAILLDHNALARHRIDLQTKVSLPSGRTYYKRIIDTLLNQAQLTSEVRVDEAGKAFLWIFTLKR
jgi:hypothetical protein